jgi:phosphogluconate dehydratase
VTAGVASAAPLTASTGVTEPALTSLYAPTDGAPMPAARVMPPTLATQNGHGLGRELFAGMRRNVLSAEEGAISWL